MSHRNQSCFRARGENDWSKFGGPCLEMSEQIFCPLADWTDSCGFLTLNKEVCSKASDL